MNNRIKHVRDLKEEFEEVLARGVDCNKYNIKGANMNKTNLAKIYEKDDKFYMDILDTSANNGVFNSNSDLITITIDGVDYTLSENFITSEFKRLIEATAELPKTFGDIVRHKEYRPNVYGIFVTPDGLIVNREGIEPNYKYLKILLGEAVIMESFNFNPGMGYYQSAYESRPTLFNQAAIRPDGVGEVILNGFKLIIDDITGINSVDAIIDRLYITDLSGRKIKVKEALSNGKNEVTYPEWILELKLAIRKYLGESTIKKCVTIYKSLSNEGQGWMIEIRDAEKNEKSNIRILLTKKFIKLIDDNNKAIKIHAENIGQADVERILLEEVERFKKNRK